LLALNKGFPPKIILLRTGNQSTRYIAGIISKHKSEVIDFIVHDEYGVLEIY
jgi:predicted nuclease of predicted toxin-antitoxin system